jgi:UDP-N-acetylmuramate-alanine ligase
LGDGPDQILAKLKDVLQPGDVILTLGAGDVYKIGEALLQGDNP